MTNDRSSQFDSGQQPLVFLSLSPPPLALLEHLPETLSHVPRDGSLESRDTVLDHDFLSNIFIGLICTFVAECEDGGEVLLDFVLLLLLFSML